MAVPEKWRFVIQPWKAYPPAVASIRVLNTDDDGYTILFLEPMWAFGRRVYAEDEILYMTTKRGNTNHVDVPLGNGNVTGWNQRNQAPRDERFSYLTYHESEPTKHGTAPTAMVVSHADAVKWNKEFLRSMVMDQKDYDAVMNPMIEYVQIITEQMVREAGMGSEWDSIDAAEIMEEAQQEAEDFVAILSDDQIIRLNYLYTGDSINEVNASPNAEKIVENLRSETVDGIMEHIYVDNDDIYSAHVAHMEYLRESQYDNWEPSYAP
jgi:hypothetical protein